MKYILCITLCIFFTACTAKHADLKTVEGLSEYLFRKSFPAIATDASLLKLYSIKKVPMTEDDEVVWDAYEFYLNSKLVFMVENNWESKTKTDRITFLHPEVKTKAQICGGAPFKQIRHLIDTTRLNHGPDGHLFFFDAKNPCMTYYFELPENSKLVYGISSLSEVPDNLIIDAVIMQDCNKAE